MRIYEINSGKSVSEARRNNFGREISNVQGQSLSKKLASGDPTAQQALGQAKDSQQSNISDVPVNDLSTPQQRLDAKRAIAQRYTTDSNLSQTTTDTTNGTTQPNITAMPNNAKKGISWGGVKDVASDIGDWTKSAIYKTTGFGGDPANAAATRIKFLNDFQQELSLAQRSARKAGQPYDNATFVNQYIKRYGWTIDPQELNQVMDVKDDPKKLANAMYNVAVGQRKGTGQYASKVDGYYPATKGTAQSTTQPEAEITPKTQQIMSTIQKMTGSTNLDDLTKIAKTAMQTLYKQNSTAYNNLYKEITRTGGSKPNKLTDPSGRVEPTMNESETKTRKISNRNK